MFPGDFAPASVFPLPFVAQRSDKIGDIVFADDVVDLEKSSGSRASAME